VRTTAYVREGKFGDEKNRRMQIIKDTRARGLSEMIFNVLFLIKFYCIFLLISARSFRAGHGSVTIITIEIGTNGATTLSRMNLSGYAGYVTTFG